MGIALVEYGNNIYDGTAVVASGKTVEAGDFVELTVAADGNTVAQCAPTPTTTPYLVVVEDDTIEEQGVDTASITLGEGKNVKLKRLLPGERFVTSGVTDTVVVGDKLCAANGKLVKVGADATPVQTYQVAEITTIAGVKCHRMIVLD